MTNNGYGGIDEDTRRQKEQNGQNERDEETQLAECVYVCSFAVA